MAFYPFGPSAAFGNNLPWEPSDNGLLAANASLDAVGNTFTPVAGTVYLGKIWARAPLTVTALAYQVRTAGVGASSGSFVGAYSSAGVLLSQSADIGANLLTANDYSSTLGAPQPIPGGSFFWAAFLSNLATTQAVLNTYAASSFTIPNMGLAPATARAATFGAGLTSLPASFTPSALTPAGVPIWFGVF